MSTQATDSPARPVFDRLHLEFSAGHPTMEVLEGILAARGEDIDAAALVVAFMRATGPHDAALALADFVRKELEVADLPGIVRRNAMALLDLVGAPRSTDTAADLLFERHNARCHAERAAACVLALRRLRDDDLEEAVAVVDVETREAVRELAAISEPVDLHATGFAEECAAIRRRLEAHLAGVAATAGRAA